MASLLSLIVASPELAELIRQQDVDARSWRARKPSFETDETTLRAGRDLGGRLEQLAVDPRPEPLDQLIEAEIRGEPTPRFLLGELAWTANPASAATYAGGECPACQGRTPPRRSCCLICHATTMAAEGKPMQRLRQPKGKGRKAKGKLRGGTR